METAEDFRAKAAHCRRLLVNLTDDTARTGLADLAEELEAKARAADAAERPVAK
ncbi:MAG: hypothetical protein JWR84_372 [Caulobacter sp.]|nr:hypothetical protein [Caulobacter sp.]